MALWRRLLGLPAADGRPAIDEATARRGALRKVMPALVPQMVDAHAVAASREVQPLLDPLALGLVVESRDAQGRRSQVAVDPVARFDVAFAAAMRVAKDNLIIASLDRWRRHGDGLFVSPWDDDLDAARLCLPEIFRDVPLRGAPVVVAVSCTHVAAAGADDPAALDALAAYAHQAADEHDDPLPLVPLQLVGMERWVRCELPQLDGVRSLAAGPARQGSDRRVA